MTELVTRVSGWRRVFPPAGSLNRRAATIVGQLARDPRGGVTAFMAIAAVPLVALVGLGADTARGYVVKARLSQALDAAGLAAARASTDTKAKSDALMFFNANFPAGFMNATVPSPTITIDDTKGTVTMTAKATLPTTFMQLVGIKTVGVSGSTVVQKSSRGMELMLVLDNTGSMASNNKMVALQAAATNLINIVYGPNETIPSLYVGLTPYVATVNIGKNNASFLTAGSLDQTKYGTDTWKGCVEARPFPYEEDQAEALPGTKGWTPYLWASTKGQTWKDGKNTTVLGDNNWPAASAPLYNETTAAGNNAYGPNLGCGPPITPLQSSKTVALNAIAAMGPWSRGGTMGNLGLAWGWRGLSPKWRGMWGTATPSTVPVDYNTALIDKVVIMLTDGVNEWYDLPAFQWTSTSTNYFTKNTWYGAPGCAGVQTPCNWPSDADYTAYGRLSQARLGTTNNATATGIVNTRFANLCTSMKADGIIIYTILLQTNDAATNALYQNCASKPSYYFSSPTSADLAGIFTQIATQITNLRLAQ